MSRFRPCNKGKVLIIFLLVLLILLGVTSALVYYARQKPEPTPEDTPSSDLMIDYRVLTVGTDSRPICMLFEAANHYIPQGKFRIEPVFVEDPNERWSLLKAGVLDLCFASLPEFVLGAARHDPGKLLLTISTSNGCDGIVFKENIQSIDDLLGGKIALVSGSAGHYFLIRAFDSGAKSTSEVQLIPAPSPFHTLEFFSKGEDIDACVLSQPYLSMALKDGRYALTTKDRNFGIEEIISASNLAVENRPDDIQAFINAYFSIVYLIRTNPGLAKSLITKESGRSVQDVDQLFQTTLFKDLSDSKAISQDSLVQEMQKIQQIWGIEGLANARNKVEFDEIIDYRFLMNSQVDGALFNDTLYDDVWKDITPPVETSPAPLPSIPDTIPQIDPSSHISPSPDTEDIQEHEEPDEIIDDNKTGVPSP